ncbi:MAG: cellulase family glycosylhydrolase [Vampirovibrionales bacterium]|nr:cellulase family glycosylhydrolase [Vampirovibrionales bacterium]
MSILPVLPPFKVYTSAAPLSERIYSSSDSPTCSRISQKQLLAAHYPWLARGINFENWFGDSKKYAKTPDYANRYISNAELQQLKRLGFTHLRVPIDPILILDRQRSDKTNPETLEVLAVSLQRALANGLAVVVDMHPRYPLGETGFKQGVDLKQGVASDDALLSDFARMWQTVAARLHQLDAHRIFFETMNEPNLAESVPDARRRWERAQNAMIGAIRSGAPENTIIVKGYDYDNVKSLASFTPKNNGIVDENVIYSIHFYTPHEFTHQGAGWTPGGYAKLHDLPYPLGPANLPQAVASVRDFATPEAKKLGLKYVAGAYNAKMLEAEIQQAAEWAAQNDKKLYMGEFGVYRPHSQPQDRARWIADVRNACDRFGIAWSFWEYDEGFGMAHKINGQRVFDPAILNALGLTL